jgi:hypothetical protein
MTESTDVAATTTGDGTQPEFAHAVTFVNHGARVRLEASTSRALERATRVLPIGSRIEPLHAPDAVFSLSVAPGVATADAPHRLYQDSAIVQSSSDLEPLLQRLESELHFAVATNARSSLFVHAGVVGWHGHAIVLPGPSMSGKSSLVAALLRAGADYYSDEYAIIDDQGGVHPYARPLRLRVEEGGREAAGPQPWVGPVGTRPLLASLIVSTHYSPGAHFEPAERRRSRGLMILIANTVLIRERPRFALDYLLPIADGATTLEGVRGDADQAAAWLLRYQNLESEHGRLPTGR